MTPPLPRRGSQADSPGSRLSLGLAHLKGLAEAGLTHVHLLPSYDFGSVPEREEEQLSVQVWGTKGSAAEPKP